jgi:CheY-like chemotaxis protein
MPAESLLDRIRAAGDHVPVLLICGDRTPEHTALVQRVQTCLPRALSARLVTAEVDLWLGAPAPAAPSAPANGHGRVLLVDDEERLRTLVQQFLELNGFTVDTAGSGEEALRKIEQSEPQAVVLDVRMPGMDGVLALKKLRLRHPQLPVIILTHADDEKTRDEAMALGVRCYLTKPLNFGLLKEALSSTKFPASSSNG